MKAVLFDMDGILYDSEWFYMDGTIKQMLAYGYQKPIEKIYDIIGTTMDQTYQILYDLLDHKIPLETIHKNNEHYFGVEHPISYREIMFQDIPDSLKRLKDAGLRLACCSSSPEKTIRKSLASMQIMQYFDFIESGDNIERPKPDPQIYQLAMQAFDLQPHECVVYEDSCAGIQAGKASGAFTVARKDTRFYQDQSQADMFVESATMLVDYILNLKEENNGRSH